MTDLPDDDDPYLWLEEVHGEQALAWVRERNMQSQGELTARPDYAPTRAQMLEVLNARDRIPYFARRGDWLYNLWQDESHKRGLWRRTTLAEYRRPDPAWETMLDLDALAEAEGENWVWGGATCHGPSYRRGLLCLSRGGADAKVVREFDLVDKRFVDGGFVLPEAKSEVHWIDDDAVYVATDVGPGSMTDSGYPRIVKRWQRGTPLSEAATVFEAETADVAASVSVDRTPGFERTLFIRSIDFYHQTFFLLQDGALVKLDVPSDASPAFMRDSLLLSIRSDWTIGDETFAAGSLLVADAAAYLRGERRLRALFTPTATRSLAGYTTTRDHVIVDVLDNVASKLEQWHKRGSEFVFSAIEAPFPGTLGVSALHDELIPDDPLADQYLVTYTDFLTPDSLFLATAGSDTRELLKSRQPLFDARGMRVEQRFAVSADGTRVPYFIVWPQGARADGNNPTLLYGYGGFEISLNPWYSGSIGRAWHQGGGVYVVANIRGGGEFGPAWHQAAIKEHKQRSYDDFIAVAEDLIAHKVTSPRHLGIEGGSNGGLLVGAVLVQRPELFNAVVCQVPLLDMRRYHRLLAGASWMAEYGDPDRADDWAVISRYSPYHNVSAAATYPRVLFVTSTRDDRVHPAHARKMVARMLEQGHDPLYFENIEGGHGAAADNEQRAHLQALEYSYLWQRLGGPAQQVLDFWFGRSGGQRAEWFRKDPAFDAQIRERFGNLVAQAVRGELRDWQDTAPSALARILLLDQFTRNIHRDSAQAFAGDALALEAARTMVERGQDRELPAEQRSFVYLPFEHAEEMAAQDEAVRLFKALGEDAPELQGLMEWVQRHRAIIERFGRFPHRNEVLGRASTAEEIEFLREPGSRF